MFITVTVMHWQGHVGISSGYVVGHPAKNRERSGIANDIMLIFMNIREYFSIFYK